MSEQEFGERLSFVLAAAIEHEILESRELGQLRIQHHISGGLAL